MKTILPMTALALAFASASALASPQPRPVQNTFTTPPPKSPQLNMDRQHSLQPTHADARMEERIITALQLNRNLNHFALDVEVKGNKAVLTGTVDEVVHKDLAERVAMNTQGITRVENNINVDTAWEMPLSSTNERSYNDRVGDATTSASVKSRLLWNQNTSGRDINVETREGHVTLEGEVATQEEKAYAERLALDSEGVRSVKNHLQVTGGPPSSDLTQNQKETQSHEVMSDTWITARVKSSLLYSRSVRGLDVTVETTNGVVTLGGTATTRERDLAIAVAKDVRGVTRVDASSMKIRV